MIETVTDDSSFFDGSRGEFPGEYCGQAFRGSLRTSTWTSCAVARR